MKLNLLKKLFFLILVNLSLFFVKIYAQTLGGIVNTYACVIDYDGFHGTCEYGTKMTVDGASVFAVGDKVLIIQAKGADAAQGRFNINYGTVSNYNSAGKCEFATIKSITGNVIEFEKYLYNKYQYGAALQVVKVAKYASNVATSSTVTCPAFDGCKGGVIVIESKGIVTLNHDIDASRKGFRGGEDKDNTTTAGNLLMVYPGNDERGAMKGEGIASIDFFDPSGINTRGRGCFGNAGGGGNGHNSGGGGG
ncbi:MAG: hypothetical protein ACO1PI_02930, partial [Bacteroidota bacterium]